MPETENMMLRGSPGFTLYGDPAFCFHKRVRNKPQRTCLAARYPDLQTRGGLCIFLWRNLNAICPSLVLPPMRVDLKKVEGSLGSFRYILYIVFWFNLKRNPYWHLLSQWLLCVDIMLNTARATNTVRVQSLPDLSCYFFPSVHVVVHGT